jgi:hypothetical protein
MLSQTMGCLAREASIGKGIRSAKKKKIKVLGSSFNKVLGK